MYTNEYGVMQISHDPGSHDPDPGPQEKSMKTSPTYSDHAALSAWLGKQLIIILNLTEEFIPFATCIHTPMVSL